MSATARWPRVVACALVAASALVGASGVCGGAAVARAQLPPAEAAARLVAHEQLEVELFASEPLITNPAAIDVDTHGRVWVAEIQFYRRAAKDPPADKIKVLEDTNGDGRADRVTVFAEGVFCPMSICVAGPRVYVATSPDLWVYEDLDGDLRADGPPRKLLTGFGGHNHDHGAHSLVLGPDHKWWMSHGDAGFDVVGTDGSRAAFKWGAVVRGELDGSRLEVVAANFRNPYEVCVSSWGEAFLSDNDNDGLASTRICWLLEGGDYGWFGAPPPRVPPGTPYGEGWHFRAHVPGHVPATLVTGFGSPCGICFYEGDAFGPLLKNTPLHTDAGTRELRSYPHEPRGYGRVASARVLLTSQGDDYFRPDDVCVAPDGTLYVSDWYDGGVGGHAYNNPEQGRIYRIRPRGVRPVAAAPPGPFATVSEAIQGLKSPNLATQFLARERLLATAAEPSASDGPHGEARAALEALLASPAAATEPHYAARALWVLDRLGEPARDVVRRHLDSDDESLRSLAVRILRRHGGDDAARLLPLADDPAPDVRREVLLALPAIAGDHAASSAALATLVERARSYDGSDRYQLESLKLAAAGREAPLVAELSTDDVLTAARIELLQVLDPQAASGLLMTALGEAQRPLDERLRILEMLAASPAPAAGRSLMGLVAEPAAPMQLRRRALAILDANLATTWQELARGDELAALVRGLLKDYTWSGSALALIGRHGLSRFASETLSLAISLDPPPAVRVQATEVAVSLGIDDIAQPLRAMLADPQPEMRSAALVGLVQLQEWAAIKHVLAARDSNADMQSEAIDRTMDSAAGALMLLRMIDQDQLAVELREQSLARAAAHPDSNVRVLFERHLPEALRPVPLGDAVQAASILELAGHAQRGSAIFFESTAVQCSRCHSVLGRGGDLGPDLSQVGKKYERATLLETILEPSRAIAPEYVPYLAETDDGRIHVGFLVEQNDERVVLKDAESRLIRLPAAGVAQLLRQEKSLMPELLLGQTTAQDAADLLAFLASLTEAVQPVARFRVLGPLLARERDSLQRDLGPEAQLAEPDLSAQYSGAHNRRFGWHVVTAHDQGGFLGFDQVLFDTEQELPTENVAHYYLFFADSSTAQTATLLLGSDDSARVWLNGQLRHEYQGRRALAFASDRVELPLDEGRNTVVVKVINHDGPGGVSLAIQSPHAVRLSTE